jgi:hypothetical protein
MPRLHLQILTLDCDTVEICDTLAKMNVFVYYTYVNAAEI